MRRFGSLALLALLAGCTGDLEDDGGASRETATYAVRGRVLEPWNGERLAVRHEAIGDFRGVSGEAEPMAEMSMRFPVAPDLGVEELVVGDFVAFELSVDWQRRPPHRIESLERLPADTVLKLER